MGIISNLFFTRIYSVINDDHVQNFRMLTDLKKILENHGRANGYEYGRSDTADEVVNELMGTLTAHLFREECLMRATRYDGYAQHRAEHVRLLRSIQVFQASALKTVQPMTGAVVQHLRDWIISHINSSDHRFELYMNNYRGPIDEDLLTDDEWMALSPQNIDLTAKSVVLWATLTFCKTPRVVMPANVASAASENDLIADRLRRMGERSPQRRYA